MRSPTAHDDADTHEPSLPEPADRAWGAFTESAPWVLDRADIRWLPVAADLRAAARAEVPVLTRGGRWCDWWCE